jgi:tetratricopeptide (TPR) repeat protein
MMPQSRAKHAMLALLIGALMSASIEATRADLAKARSFYNQRRFDQAIEAATAAQKTPATSNAATVVLARAHLERYRERADPADLAAARAALGNVVTGDLESTDRVDFLMALGQALFLQDDYGAAARLFESGLSSASAVGPDSLEAMLDWWGSAVERHAEALDRDKRPAAFARLGDRMAQELAHNPGSGAAGYWSVVAARGSGDAVAAWDLAIASWVRARLAGTRAATLRADLDKLVLEGIIPDLARTYPADQRERETSELRAEWELTKQRWK